MNINYAKAILYAYKCLDSVMEQIDELVEKKAFASISDLSPCEVQCEKILALTAQKDVLITLKIKVEGILKEFSEKEYSYFEYKYFRYKDNNTCENLDTTSRNYFRMQIKLAKLFARKLESVGISDDWIKQNCMGIDFFRELLRRVIEKENALKNTGAKKIKKCEVDKRILKKIA